MIHNSNQSWFTSLLALVLLCFASCGPGIKSHSYKSKGVDLKKYKTYAWVKPNNEEEDSRKDDKQYASFILQLADEELKKKGFVLNTEQPDAVFLFDTRVEDRVSYSQSPQVSVGVGFGGPGYYGGFAAPVAGGAIVQNNYLQGMLFIEMYDTKTKELLWRGWAEEEITSQNHIESDLRTAVKHIFIRLPIKHK